MSMAVYRLSSVIRRRGELPTLGDRAPPTFQSDPTGNHLFLGTFHESKIARLALYVAPVQQETLH